MKQPAHYIEEAILVILILLNIVDFIGKLTPDLDFLKKVISWTCLGYLLFQISMTKQLFGNKKKILDGILLVIFFLLVFKNIIGVSLVSYEEFHKQALDNKVSLVYPLVEFIRDPVHHGRNANLLEHYTFSIGGLLLIAFALYCTFFVRIGKPSVLHVLHEDEPNKRNFFTESKKFILLYLVLVGFFVLIFNLMMEWLALAVDASLLVFTMVFYLFTVFRRHHKTFHAESFINKVGSAGEELYTSVLELFHVKKKFIIGISGLLVLHLLTDVGIYFVPYLFGFRYVLYLDQLGPSHQPLLSLFFDEIGKHAFPIFGIILIYFLNIIAMLSLLILPAIIWYTLFRGKIMHVSSLTLSIFLTALIAFVFAPIFKLKAIFGSNLLGVDILTHLIQPRISFTLTLLLLGSVGLITLYLSSYRRFKRYFLLISLIFLAAFFLFYIGMYFVSVASYYLSAIISLFSAQSYIAGVYFVLFLLITIIFYTSGFLIFIIEMKREFASELHIRFK